MCTRAIDEFCLGSIVYMWTGQVFDCLLSEHYIVYRIYTYEDIHMSVILLAMSKNSSVGVQLGSSNKTLLPLSADCVIPYEVAKINIYTSTSLTNSKCCKQINMFIVLHTEYRGIFPRTVICESDTKLSILPVGNTGQDS